MRIALIILALIALSCKEKKGIVGRDENDGDPVFKVTNEDKEMNQAIMKARSTYDDFLATLKNPDRLIESFSVKMKFDNAGGSGEHMWLTDPFFKNEKLFGILDSDPVDVKTVKSGDTLEIIRERISDWMYVRENKLVGGYTIKALYNKLSKKEQQEFRDELSFELE